MVKKLSTPTRGEIIRALKERYMESSKKEKTKIGEAFIITWEAADQPADIPTSLPAPRLPDI